jgi:primosomal protein N' (replication factor Y)
MADMTQPIAQVAVFTPLRRHFDYLATADARAGMRVSVPFGRGHRIGLILQLSDHSSCPANKLKPLSELLDRSALLSAEQIDFLCWTASYYQYPIGEVIAAALPTLLRTGKPLPEPGEPGWQLNPATAAEHAPEPLQRAPRQRQIMALLLACGPAGISQTGLFAQLGACRSSLQALADKGLVQAVRVQSGSAHPPALSGPPLNPAQQQATQRIIDSEGFQPHLLDGVTGSGKTEIYLEASRAIIARGRQVLVLVPEIALTPQTTRRFATRLGLTPLVLHSGLNDSERASAWWQASQAKVPLTLGTRSAIFTPMPQLGLVIIDEEHDLSFKQQEGFRYSARDLALVRASRARCPIVLGSATPSLESLYNLGQKRFSLLRLDQRAGDALPPQIQLLDIRSAPLRSGLSRPLLHAISRELQQGNQVMLFLNRRGFSPVLICHDCSWIAHCRHCDARMSVHLGEQRLCCHHCGLVLRLPGQCPECQGSRLINHGVGTEQLEQALTEQFPDYPSVRIDRDSTRRKGSLQRMLESVRQGRFQLLLGTQMLAKGHDFPNVTLVGMVDIDQGLFGADFRATERMAQLITQVAGRAGRGSKPGRVLIQTRQADHPLLNALIDRGYRHCASELLQERRLAQLPPFSHQALLRADATTMQQAEGFLNQAMQLGRELGNPHIEFWGPAPASMERRAGRYRQQLLVQCASRTQLQRFLTRWLEGMDRLPLQGKLRWSLDVDPQEML